MPINLVANVIYYKNKLVIGQNEDLVIRLAEDMKFFKSITCKYNVTNGMNIVVMGRKTWESLPVRPLPNRRNIVVSSNEIAGVQTFTADQVNSTCQLLSSPVWMIGGAKLLAHTIDVIDEIWLSRVIGDFDCDTVLPKDIILEKFVLYERYFDGTLTTEKYTRKTNEANIISN